MRNNSGFTLIEMVVTIALISVVLAVAIPKIDIDFGYMDKMASEFVMDVRYIQTEHMKVADSNHEIKIYKNTNTYEVRQNLNVEKVVRFKERFSIMYNNGGTISFTNTGTPINAGTLTIMDKKTMETKKISIVPGTGRTIILE
ncbi:prepilin-type N-terminal cleavage/methylation domain-containing protein [Sedimentibacter acidaminivorans]|uniref:Prepilin-type N-terminal cleavage/methylation domain-containing protein n=1 Tax=Sedimentibacter acidaminivorans TaxID=913099 RepID=A0ABS4GI36_9FIRM|nr:type II secretion system protein [Sedimentibacter acidaminivorans]MBP1927324.1 prepilin-type N-terminal cleavage/methylation domain-containing protein [Sedimentibacter acidaminivorans]